MSIFLETLERTRGTNLTAVAELLRSGYQLTEADLAYLGTRSIQWGRQSKADENGDTDHSIMLADAWSHYDALLANGRSKEKALKETCDIFPVSLITLLDVVRGGRRPVRAIRNRRRVSDSCY